MQVLLLLQLVVKLKLPMDYTDNMATLVHVVEQEDNPEARDFLAILDTDGNRDTVLGYKNLGLDQCLDLQPVDEHFERV